MRTRVNTTITPATVSLCCDYRHNDEAVSSSLRLRASSLVSATFRKPCGSSCAPPPPTSPASLPLRASSSLHFASSTFSKCHSLISRVSNDARNRQHTARYDGGCWEKQKAITVLCFSSYITKCFTLSSSEVIIHNI